MKSQSNIVIGIFLLAAGCAQFQHQSGGWPKLKIQTMNCLWVVAGMGLLCGCIVPGTPAPLNLSSPHKITRESTRFIEVGTSKQEIVDLRKDGPSGETVEQFLERWASTGR